MATTNDCQGALGVLATSWFSSPAAEFAALGGAVNVRDFNTTPDDSSASPNWCIFRVLYTTADSEVFDNTDAPTRIVCFLATRLGKSDAEREAAERWLNDAEEMMVKQLYEVGATADWYELAIIGNPRRDVHKQFHGKMRTSDILIEIDKMN
jgi:hypothetical protein